MTRTSNVSADSIDALVDRWSRAVGKAAAAEAQATQATELLLDVAVAWQQYGPPPGPAADMTELLGRLRHLLLTSPKWLPDSEGVSSTGEGGGTSSAKPTEET